MYVCVREREREREREGHCVASHVELQLTIIFIVD